MGVLTVVLEKVTNLVDNDLLGKSDPFLKFVLEKDRALMDKTLGKKKSTKKRNQLNPVYNEVFVFEEVPNLKNMRLNVYVMDNDIGIDDNIASVPVELEDMNLTETPTPIQFTIQARNSKPTVYLKLSYIAAN